MTGGSRWNLQEDELKPQMAVLESIGMAIIGIVGIAAIDVCTDLRVFSPYITGWLPLVAPIVVGFAIGIAHPNFRLNLGIAIGASVLSGVVYFFVYTLLHLPAISFSGVAYPPDPAQKFIIYFMMNIVTLLGGVTVGGFLSGE